MTTIDNDEVKRTIEVSADPDGICDLFPREHRRGPFLRMSWGTQYFRTRFTLCSACATELSGRILATVTMDAILKGVKDAINRAEEKLKNEQIQDNSNSRG
jgi:hypothetical protein